MAVTRSEHGSLIATKDDIDEITTEFYRRMFAAHPELLRNLFNRGNQAQGAQQRAGVVDERAELARQVVHVDGHPGRRTIGLGRAARHAVGQAHPVRHRWITEEELDANPGLVRSMSVQPPRGHGRVRLIEPAAFTKVSALGVEEQRVNLVADIITPAGRRANLGDGFRVEARMETASDRLRPGMEGVGKISAGERRLLWIWTHSLTDWLRLWEAL